MNTNINTSLLKTFILEKVGDKLNADEAQKLKITEEYNNLAEELDQTEIHFVDIVQDDEGLYEQFAVLYTEEKEQKAAAKDKEAEKEEQNKVQDKNQAGV